MFGKKEKPSISAAHTLAFAELLLVRLQRGEELDTALSALQDFRFSPRLFELLDQDADLLPSQLTKDSGPFMLLCALIQLTRHEGSFRIVDGLVLFKIRMMDLLYDQGSADLVVFHGKKPKQYARELLQLRS